MDPLTPQDPPPFLQGPQDAPAPGDSQAAFDARAAAAKTSAQVTSQGPALPPEGEQLPANLAAAPVGALAGEPAQVDDRTVSHSDPILTQGAQGQSVVKLCKLLAHAGFASNTVVQGQNPHDILDSSVMGDVERFWQAYPDAREPDSLYAGRQGDLSSMQGRWVGPMTWQKLYELVAEKTIG